jgi:hypothetical protein
MYRTKRSSFTTSKDSEYRQLRAQRSILECMGHHPKGMERLLKEDHLRINCRHHRLDYLKLLATTYITKKEPRVFHNARGLFTKLNYLNQKFL